MGYLSIHSRSLTVLIGLIGLFPIIPGTAVAACTFRTAPTAMNFGTLDPASTADVIATSDVTIRCSPPGPNPVPYTIADNNGLYFGGATASRRMRNTAVTTEFLPYDLSYTAAGSIPRNTNVVITFTGTVRASSYQDAYIGAYGDSITITINP